MDGSGIEDQSPHLFVVKANSDSIVDGIAYDYFTMAIASDPGTVYDQSSVDESWIEKSEKEYAIYMAVNGYIVDMNYNGEPILVNSETHISLSDSDIAEINQALYQ